MLAILQLGVDAWFADPDVVALRDPWPTLRLHLPCDYVFAHEKSEHGFNLEALNLNEEHIGWWRRREYWLPQAAE